MPGVAVRLLQALATLLSSPHGGALALAMHRSHVLACPLMRQLCQYQVGLGWAALASPAPSTPAQVLAPSCVLRITGGARWALTVEGGRCAAGGFWGSGPSEPCLARPQRCAPQDTGFSSLFLKVLVQALQWLDGPSVEAGPLQAQLRLFAAQCSARRRISNGEAGLPGSAVASGGLFPGGPAASGAWSSGFRARAQGWPLGEGSVWGN